MKLSSFLHPNLIRINHDAGFSESVIRDLSREACKGFPPEFEEKVVTAVLEREKQGPTIERGVSIPHARISDFSDLIISVSIPKKPVIVEGKTVKIFFLILTANASPLYLNVLSAIAQLSMNDALMSSILSCRKPEDMIKTIKDANINVKEELTVKDIMDKDFPSVSFDMTLKEAIDILNEKKSLFALVSDKGKFSGEITLSGIVEKKMPKYALDLVNLSFLKTFQPVEDILKDEASIKVGDIMVPAKVVLEPGSSIVEAVLRMVKEKKPFISVVEEGKAVGVITLRGFIKRVLRA